MESVPEYDPRYLKGIWLFNHGDFFEAHEVWEDVWGETAGNDRRFYQGLIQAAVALCHFGNGNLRGAISLYNSSRRYMESFDSPHAGLDIKTFWQAMERCFADILKNETAHKHTLDETLLPRITLDPAPAIWPGLEDLDNEEQVTP